MLNITNVRVKKIQGAGKLKAVVSIIFDDAFVVHDIKVVEGQNGLFIAMPSKKIGDSDYRDIAHPIHADARAHIQSLIFEEYGKIEDPVEEPAMAVEEGQQEEAQPDSTEEPEESEE